MSHVALGWVAAIVVSCLAACGGDTHTLECPAGEQAVDSDGDDSPEACEPIVGNGGEGEPCSFDYPCSNTDLQCFFEQCYGTDCRYDIGVCSLERAGGVADGGT